MYTIENEHNNEVAKEGSGCSGMDEIVLGTRDGMASDRFFSHLEVRNEYMVYDI